MADLAATARGTGAEAPGAADAGPPYADLVSVRGRDAEPVPYDARVRLLETADGVKIRFAAFPGNTPRSLGSVIILQGRAEFIEKYLETIRELRGRGFAVASFDWRGQGGSQRLLRNPFRGHVRRFADYRLDLDAALSAAAERWMPKPWFVLAHSMGGAILLDRLGDPSERWEPPFERLVALAPMCGLARLRAPGAAAGLAAGLNALGLGRAFIPGGRARSISLAPFEGNILTRDPRRYARNAAILAARPGLGIGDPTISWTAEAFAVMRHLSELKRMRRVALPTLVLPAGDDPLISTPAVERLALSLKAGRAVAIPGARHEILMERDGVRDLFWAAFDAYVPGSPPIGALLPPAA